METVFGREPREILTSMRDSTQMIANLDMESSPGRQETFTRATTKTIRGTGLERCTGTMAVTTKDIGKKESSTVMARFMYPRKDGRKDNFKIMSSFTSKMNSTTIPSKEKESLPSSNTED